MGDAGVAFRFIADPTPGDVDRILHLYRAAGWWGRPRETDRTDVSRLVAGSHCFLAAFLDGRLVAMGRAISDGVSDAYIQDVTVDESLRRRGVGSGLVRLLVDRLRADGIRWVGLIASNNTEDFYRPLGFLPVPGAEAMLLGKVR